MRRPWAGRLERPPTVPAIRAAGGREGRARTPAMPPDPLRPFSFGRDARAGYGSAPRKPITSTTRPESRHPYNHARNRAHAPRPRAHGGQGRFVRLLAPDVDKVLIQPMLGRSAYSTAEERDAETLASLILTSVKR